MGILAETTQEAFKEFTRFAQNLIIYINRACIRMMSFTARSIRTSLRAEIDGWKILRREMLKLYVWKFYRVLEPMAEI
jgi:hypothetical protein